jgi:alkylated DNA repair dioxygenase AlkB
MLHRTEIRDGGLLLYDEAFFPLAEADALFAWIRANFAWQQEMSRGRPFPRLTAFVADAGLEYRYSGVTHRGGGWPAVLLDVKSRVEAAAQAEFNSLLLNLYRNGRDSIGFHADDEPELGRNPVVVSVSLGAVRKFILKRPELKEKRTFELAHGSLLVMAGTCQHFWRHAVPKTSLKVGERINLTFRRILASDDQRYSSRIG